MAAQPFDWSTYYTLAVELAARDNEACRRSAISRAYYYVYHIARARAERNGFQPDRNDSSHKQLWKLFSNSVDPGCQQLAIIAGRLKEKRERADYVPTFPRIADEIPGLMNDAQKFANLLNTVQQRHPVPR